MLLYFRMSLAIPLVDGMVVSHRALGSMVRQTASNTFRRKRLDNEGYVCLSVFNDNLVISTCQYIRENT